MVTLADRMPSGLAIEGIVPVFANLLAHTPGGRSHLSSNGNEAWQFMMSNPDGNL